MIYDYLKKLRDNGFYPRHVLDIGANVGNFSIECEKIWPILTNFYLIEPNKECQYNLQATGFNVYLNLVGDKDDEDVIFYKTTDFIKGTGNSIYREKTKHYDTGHFIEEHQRMVTINTLFKNSDIKFDFAKLDTQGSELDILKGGMEIFSKCKYILIEVSLKQYNENVPLKNDIIDFMNKHGFSKYEVIETHIWNQSNTIGINPGEIFQEDIIFFK